jgi:hypothetical protein
VSRTALLATLSKIIMFGASKMALAPALSFGKIGNRQQDAPERDLTPIASGADPITSMLGPCNDDDFDVLARRSYF